MQGSECGATGDPRAGARGSGPSADGPPCGHGILDTASSVCLENPERGWL